MTRVKTDSESSEATLAIRKSRRLSGIRPDLTLQEAQAQVDSPRRSRRHSGGSDVSDTSHTAHDDPPLAPSQTAPTKLAPIPEVLPVKSAPSTILAPPPTKKSVANIVDRLIQPVSIPKGKCKSGRFWKSDRDRFRSVIQSNKGLKTTFEARAQRKEEIQRVKAYEQSLKEELRLKKVEHQQRRAENLKRKEENQKKSEVYQIIKNPAKIKRMKKKQLKMLVKRDVLDQVQK